MGGVLCRRPYMSRMLWSGGARQENEDLPLRGIERELIDGRGRSRSTPGTGAGRGAGFRDRHADSSPCGGRGRRVDGRGGRDVLPDCADDGRWRPEQTGADRPTGTAACSRHDRGHTPRRRRRDGCIDGRLSGGGAGPRRRSARGDLRLDNGPEPWHNSSDRLGLSDQVDECQEFVSFRRPLTRATERGPFRPFGLGAALLRRRPKGLLPAARQELLDPSKAWWGGRRGRLADRLRYSISVSLGVVPLVLPCRGSPSYASRSRLAS